MINQVFEFVDVSVQYEATGGAGKLELYSDLPGGVMVKRAEIPLPVTSGRQTTSRPLTFEGTQYRPVFTPSAFGTLRVYAASMHVRRIGVYLDGSRGETFDLKDIAVNI